MAQAKKKQATRTAKKTAARGQQARRKACTRTSKQQRANNQEKMHVYVVTVMGMITAILLCANVAMMMV